MCIQTYFDVKHFEARMANLVVGPIPPKANVASLTSRVAGLILTRMHVFTIAMSSSRRRACFAT